MNAENIEMENDGFIIFDHFYFSTQNYLTTIHKGFSVPLI